MLKAFDYKSFMHYCYDAVELIRLPVCWLRLGSFYARFMLTFSEIIKTD